MDENTDTQQRIRLRAATAFVGQQADKPFEVGRAALRQELSRLMSAHEEAEFGRDQRIADYKAENLLSDAEIASDTGRFIELVTDEEHSRYSTEAFTLGVEIAVVSEGLGRLVTANTPDYLRQAASPQLLETLGKQGDRHEIALYEIQRAGFQAIGAYDVSLAQLHGSDSRGITSSDLASAAPDIRRRAQAAVTAIDNSKVANIAYQERLALATEQAGRAMPPGSVLKANVGKTFLISREVNDPPGTMRLMVREGKQEPYRPHRFRFDGLAQQEAGGPNKTLDQAVVARTMLQEAGCNLSQAHVLTTAHDGTNRGLANVMQEVDRLFDQADSVGARGEVAISGKALARWIDRAEASFPNKAYVMSQDAPTLPPVSLRDLQTGLDRGLAS